MSNETTGTETTPTGHRVVDMDYDEFNLVKDSLNFGLLRLFNEQPEIVPKVLPVLMPVLMGLSELNRKFVAQKGRWIEG